MEAEIKVGQVWQQGTASTTYTITKIDGRMAHCICEPPSTFIKFFSTSLSNNGTVHLSDNWKEISKQNPQSRECKCGIFRGDCTYHK